MVLREMMNGRFPAATLARKKQGFNQPMGLWMRGPLMPLLDKYVSDEVVREHLLFEPAMVRRLRALLDSGRQDVSLHLWALVFLEAWVAEFEVKT